MEALDERVDELLASLGGMAQRSDVHSIRSVIAELRASKTLEEAASKPRKTRFEIRRNQSGFIKEVVATSE